MPDAVLLIAHGSRYPEANADLDWAAEELRRQGRYPIVETCFLELAQPDIPAGAQRCVAAGAETVYMLPYFLSPGLHVTEDLARARDQLTAQHPKARWVLCEPIGRHPILVEILNERLREAAQRAN